MHKEGRLTVDGGVELLFGTIPTDVEQVITKDGGGSLKQRSCRGRPLDQGSTHPDRLSTLAGNKSPTFAIDLSPRVQRPKRTALSNLRLRIVLFGCMLASPKQKRAASKETQLATAFRQDLEGSRLYQQPHHPIDEMDGLLFAHCHYVTTHVMTALGTDRMRRNRFAASRASGQLLRLLVMMRATLVATRIGMTPLWYCHDSTSKTNQDP